MIATFRDISKRRLDIVLTGLVLMVMLLVEWLDIVTGPELSMWVLYLAPIGLMAWAFGFAFAWPFVILALGLLGVEALLVSHIYSGWDAFLFAWMCRGLVMLIVAWLCDGVRRVQELKHKVQAYEELCDSLNLDLPEQQK